MIEKKYKIKYNENDDIKELINYIIKDNHKKKIDISNQLNISRSTLNTLLNKKNINLNDIKKICDTLDYEVNIEIVPKKI